MESLPPLNVQKESDKITGFITDTFSTAQKTTAIVAVSGGLDSATSLFLAATALNPDHVLALHLPAKSSHPLTTQHALLAMDKASIPEKNRITINIGAIIQKSWRIINYYSVGANPRIRPEIGQTQGSAPTPDNRLRIANLAARIRMLLLFDQAKKHNALVVGTENLSEHLLGYFTRYGDEASDLEPIRHLYKTQVIDLAKFLGVPQPIIAKKPSADLWPGQTDAAELGFTYAQADPILYHLTQHHEGADPCVCPGFDPELVTKIQNRISASSFKHQVPYKI
jgi:NAD+ synthase